MSATFSPSLGDPISRVRQSLGDTDVTNPLVQDETITAYLAKLSELGAAAQLAYDLAAKYARMATKQTVDRQTVDFSQLSAAFKSLGDRLTSKASSTAQPGQLPGTMPLGGTIISGGDSPIFDPERWWPNAATSGLYG